VDTKGVYDWLKAPKFHLLTFSNEHENGHSQRKEIETEFADIVDYHNFQITEEVAELYGHKKPFSVLLRPDNYIGFITSEEPRAELTNYFANVIGRPQARSASEATGK
jgi:hypothetical protein